MELGISLKKPRELKDWAYDVVKDAIINLDVAPGAQLSVTELSERLDVSRTPVREALLKLENDGLVRAVPRVGFFVTQVTKRDLKELFVLRELLESHAAEAAAVQLSDDDLAELDRLYQLSTVAAEKGDCKEFIEYEIKFHQLIVDRCGNQRLVEMMDSLNDLTNRERILSVRVSDNIYQSCREHAELVDALKRRDAAAAGECMRKHLVGSRHRLLAGLDIPEG